MAYGIDRDIAALLVERLSKTYADGTRALDELNLRVPARCFFGLLGPNGAGKTTLIGAAAGLVRAAPGQIFVFGHDAVTDLRARLLIGLAPQEVHLDRFVTARDVLVYHGRYFGMPRLEARRRADELLEIFDLAAKAQTKSNRLSGGMRRRLLTPARSSTSGGSSSSTSPLRASTSNSGRSSGATCAGSTPKA